MHLYARIDGSKVPKDKLHAANQAMIFCWSDLGIKNTYVSWFVEAHESPNNSDTFTSDTTLRGMVKSFADEIGVGDSFIYIWANLPLEEIAQVVFHEARHVYQFMVYGEDPRKQGINIEADAYRYAYEAGIAFNHWPDPMALTITNKKFP